MAPATFLLSRVIEDLLCDHFEQLSALITREWGSLRRALHPHPEVENLQPNRQRLPTNMRQAQEGPKKTSKEDFRNKPELDPGVFCSAEAGLGLSATPPEYSTPCIAHPMDTEKTGVISQPTAPLEGLDLVIEPAVLTHHAGTLSPSVETLAPDDPTGDKIRKQCAAKDAASGGAMRDIDSYRNGSFAVAVLSSDRMVLQAHTLPVPVSKLGLSAERFGSSDVRLGHSRYILKTGIG